MGDHTNSFHNEADYKLKWNEIAVFIPILIAIFWIGLQPAIFFSTMDASVNDMLVRMNELVPTIAMLGS
jgi:NADH:ubiquinone oxidoreductase subunit 4 (subunit M)